MNDKSLLASQVLLRKQTNLSDKKEQQQHTGMSCVQYKCNHRN